MQYFTRSDYEVFTPENAAVMTSQMAAKRKALQEKLVNLHKQIYPEVQKLGLRCHKDSRHLTTEMIDRYTGSANTWLLIRYNNTPTEFDSFASFTQFADIQYGISADKGFSIELFLGRKDGADRDEAMKRLNADRTQITEAIALLKGFGLRWELTGGNTFDLDTNEPAAFCDWLAASDKQGGESFMTCSYAPDDDRISVQNIERELLAKIRLLLPLYKLLTHRG